MSHSVAGVRFFIPGCAPAFLDIRTSYGKVGAWAKKQKDSGKHYNYCTDVLLQTASWLQRQIRIITTVFGAATA